MVKEKNIDKGEIKKIFNELQKEKDADNRAKLINRLILLVAGAATIKGIQAYGPGAVAAMTGSKVSLALLPIPNYFLVILGLGAVATGVSKYKVAKAEMKKENKGKNTKRRFKLEV